VLCGNTQFQLESFSSFQSSGNKSKIETPKFEAAGLTWHLNIYPLGNTKAVRLPACAAGLAQCQAPGTLATFAVLPVSTRASVPALPV